MISTDNKIRRDSTADQGDDTVLQPDHAAPLRADILGSIAGANPNEVGYLGKIDKLITAHGAVDMLPPRVMAAPRMMAPTQTALPPEGKAPMAAPEAPRNLGIF